MPIDASIAMGYQPIKLENPMNSLAQMMQIENAQKQNRLADFTMQTKQQEFAESNKLNALYSSAMNPDGTIDRAKLLSGAATGGLGSKIPGLQKVFLESDESQGKVDKQKVELIDLKLKQSRQFLDGITTAEQYIAWHEGNHKDPVLGPELARRGVTADQARVQISEALQQPGGLQKLLQQSALGLEKFTEMNKPSYQKTDSGQIETLLALPGLGGAPVVVNRTQKVATPGEVLTDDRTRSEGRANRGNSMEIAKMADERSRDANTIKAAEKKSVDDMTKGGQLASFDTMLGTLDRLSKHPGLSKSVGIRSVLPTVPGGDSANFQAELNTFQSQAFIPMVAQLKGMGALSDAEGKKLTQAVGALDPQMGEQAFRDSIDRIKADMESAYARVAGKPREGAAKRTVVQTGTAKDGRKVVKYSDGTVEYAN